MSKIVTVLLCECGCGQDVSGWNHHKHQAVRFKHGHHIKGNKFKEGLRPHNWQGGRWMRKDGYVFVLKKDHPKTGNTGYVMEHIIIMENHLGRLLQDREIVHHINHIRHDNRIENLQLMTSAKHKQLHTTEFWKQGLYTHNQYSSYKHREAV